MGVWMRVSNRPKYASGGTRLERNKRLNNTFVYIGMCVNLLKFAIIFRFLICLKFMLIKHYFLEILRSNFQS